MSNIDLPPKLASTASGIGFEAWKKRPVYVVQCKTAAIANQLCEVASLQGVVTRIGMSEAGDILFPKTGDSLRDGLSLFRALSPYRSEQAKVLRNAVAKHVRAERVAMRESRLTPDERLSRIEVLQQVVLDAMDSESALNRRAFDEGIAESANPVDGVDIDNPDELEDLSLPGCEKAIEELIRHLRVQLASPSSFPRNRE